MISAAERQQLARVPNAARRALVRVVVSPLTSGMTATPVSNPEDQGPIAGRGGAPTATIHEIAVLDVDRTPVGETSGLQPPIGAREHDDVEER